LSAVEKNKTKKITIMKTRILATFLFLTCFFYASATNENLNGKWTGLLKTDQGDEYPLLYNFKIEGNQLSGTAKTPKGDLPINDGKITGDSISFNVIINDMEIDHSGRFYGDSVVVDISLGDARAHTTLKRAQ
jgi:hypothetical protein